VQISAAGVAARNLRTAERHDYMFPSFSPEVLREIDNTFSAWFTRFGFDYGQFSKERWEVHRAHPNVSLEQYRCRVLHRFGQIVSNRTIVYLDLKYWINLRKALLGQPVERPYLELHSLLSGAVERGAVVCPLSFWVFQELLKQSDSGTRKATAALVDKLSNGVAFMHHGEIVSQEVLHFIRKTTPRYADVKQWPIRECIWTRTMSFLGDRIPVWPDTDIPESDQVLVQKNWEDFYFFIPFEELFRDSGSITPDFAGVLYDVADINRRKREVRLEHRSFKSLFLAELMHSIKENEPHWYEAMAYLYSLESGKEEPIDSDAMTETEKRPARNLMWWLFKKNRITNDLPSYHIPAGLYAAACWDTERQLTDNDVLDFYHAQLAIPYCDIFLTDTCLKSLACSRHLRFNEIYDTAIIADPAEAVAHLRQELHKRGGPTAPILQELFGGDTYARSA
jgi:hypothetical protein